MSNVIACIGDSKHSNAVVDYAAWATKTLQSPLTFLHVLNRQHYPITSDLSGSIGLGSREHLLEELAVLDEKRSQIALEQGRAVLEAAKQRAIADGILNCELLQRHGELFDVLHEIEQKVRLLVIGKNSEDAQKANHHIGSQLESVIRIMHRPILIVPSSSELTVSFEKPRSAILAFDGSATTRKGVEMLARSALCKSLHIHVVMIGASTEDAKAQTAWAVQCLNDANISAQSIILAGDVEPTLHQYQADHKIDMLIMGAYGHSRIRQFLVGSTTNQMIKTSQSPILLLR